MVQVAVHVRANPTLEWGRAIGDGLQVQEVFVNLTGRLAEQVEARNGGHGFLNFVQVYSI